MPFPTRCRTPWSLTLHGVRLSEALLAHVAQHERGAPASGPLQLLRVTPLFHFVRSERMEASVAPSRRVVGLNSALPVVRLSFKLCTSRLTSNHAMQSLNTDCNYPYALATDKDEAETLIGRSAA
jgi:hypothetical protein